MPSTVYVDKTARTRAHRRERISASSCAARVLQLARDALWRGGASVHSRPLLGGDRAAKSTSLPVPADFAYARAITPTQRRSGRDWRAEGVLGRFAITFVVVKDTRGEWTQYAIELNQSPQGRTTHPFLTLQFLTDGRYGGATGVPDPGGSGEAPGRQDHLESPLLRGLEPRRPVRHRGPAQPALRQAMADRRVFHMISCITSTAGSDSRRWGIRRRRRTRSIGAQSASCSTRRAARSRSRLCPAEVGPGGVSGSLEHQFGIVSPGDVGT